ncbi:hypothetical protein ACFVYF_15270 [Streptomyces sp. NPDC058274]|uniref:hypothetical protein n=1 Tax=Streptomyces sp. NPDC058274 TaxID=3346416 RepID=UPI0036DFA984
MAEYEGNPVADALLAAITDEPLPEGARDDAEFLAEHRSAVADVALLREQLTLIGDALADGTESALPVPVRASKKRARRADRAPKQRTRRPDPAPGSRRRRPLALVMGTLAATVAATVVAGMGWLVVNSGGGAADDTSNGASGAKAPGGEADSKGGSSDASSAPSVLSSPEMHIACSRVLVEGTVVSITARDDGDVRVVLKVKRYYRPERSVRDHPTIAVTLDGIAREDLKPGTYTLLRVPVHAEDRQDWEVGWGVGDARKDILKALPGAEGLACSAAPEQMEDD